MNLSTMNNTSIDKDQVTLKEYFKNAAERAKGLVVLNEDGFNKMTAMYADAKKWEKKIEDLRKESNAPDQARINARNDKAKELLCFITEIKQTAKKKSEVYQLMLEEQKRQDEESLKQAADLLGLDQVPVCPVADTSIRGEKALVYTKTVRKFRIVDAAKVPSRYLKVDEDAVEQAIKMGVAQIDGIEIYEEKVTQLRTR